MPKRGKKQPVDSLANVPEQFKLALPAIEFDAYPDVAQLQGDYILTRVISSRDHAMWQIRFPSLAGYEILVLRIVRDKDDSWSAGVTLKGGPEPAFWKREAIRDLESAFSLSLQFEQRMYGRWPSSLLIQPIVTATDATAQIQGSTLETIDCECLTDGYGKIEVSIEGVVNDDCECPVECMKCPTFANWRVLDRVGQSCGWNWFASDEDVICPWGMGYDELDISVSIVDCDVTVNLVVGAGTYYGAELKRTIPLELFDIANIPPLLLDSLGWSDPAGSCNGDNAIAYVKFVRTEDAGCNNCGNVWGTCKVSPIPLPVIDQPCEINVHCCGCGSDDVNEKIPGTSCPVTGCESAKCSPPPTIDERWFSVGFALRAPDAGSGGIGMGYSYQNIPECSRSGATRSIIDEFVTFSLTDTTAYVEKCDGSSLEYVCRDGDPGSYLSVGRNKNSLVLNANGTHTESQGNFDKNLFYDFDSTGHIFRVRKVCPPVTGSVSPGTSIWTISHDTTSSHVTDPFNRRSTATYDANGNPKRVEDVYGRVTTLVFDTDGLPTKQITPELCTTEYL